MKTISIRTLICFLPKLNSWVIYVASLYLVLVLVGCNSQGIVAQMLEPLSLFHYLHPLLVGVHVLLLVSSLFLGALLLVDTLVCYVDRERPADPDSLKQLTQLSLPRLFFFYLKTFLWIALLIAYAIT